jgi:hypothetical protein
MERMPRMTDTAFAEVRDVQRERYCVPVAEVRETLTRMTSAQDLGGDQDVEDDDPY